MVTWAQTSVPLPTGDWFPLTVMVVALGFGLWRIIARIQRRAARDKLATEQGWQPVDGGWLNQHVLPVLPRSSGAYRERITWGVHCPPKDGDPAVVLCDYQFWTRTSSGSRNGRNRSRSKTHRRSAAWLVSPVPLPAISIARSGLVSKALAAVGSRGLEVESAEFNRAFRVTAKNHRVAVAVLSPQTQARLLELEPNSLHVKNGRVVSVDGKPAKTERYADLRDSALAIVHGVPEWVEQELTGEDAMPDWEAVAD